MTCAVLCEYNPFHFGHLRQLSLLHERFSTVICLLGGDLTQRGEVAVSDRFVRARAALEGGADLVLELPLPWGCASAKDFARGGVTLAKRIGADSLAFSAESDADGLRGAAEKRLTAEPQILALRRKDPSLSYPQAAEAVLGRMLYGRPNDILAVEYLCEAKRHDMPCHIVKRDMSCLSSSAIRAAGDPFSLLPPSAANVFRADPSFPRKTERAGLFALAAVRNTDSADVYAVPPELFGRMKEKAEESKDWDTFVRSCVGRQYTASRVRRAAWALTFSFPRDLSERTVPYTTLLAANERGRAFLRMQMHLNPQMKDLLVHRKRTVASDPIFRLNERVDSVLRLFYGGEETNRPYLT